MFTLKSIKFESAPFFFVLMWVALVLGCAGTKTPVQPDDRVVVHYTCRLENGAVVATTKETVARGPEEKSSIFSMPERYAPMTLTASSSEQSLGREAGGQYATFEKCFFRSLEEAVPGLSQGRLNNIRIDYVGRSDLSDGERFLHMARVRRRLKKQTVDARLFLQNVGLVPEVGEVVDYHTGFHAQVKAVSGNNVVLEITAEPGTVIDVPPFGKGVIQDDGSRYLIVLDVPEGKLIRVGPRVGRVVANPDPRMFTVDFGHPFGGEELECEVEVVEILSGEPLTASSK
jgi:FKBP-type peptidyl-prolyl cis-trans isomerase 2